ncbi:unnamed protein product [Caenorhabditis auriculariae]|uniref:Uncharacterized protein n=1 Tax=Caenorhabditis auriculariae TaxID=2777116 RepID=A0A8S1HZ52_9PELO|nr:unnamed protein product [Caenorhabditis auriculariae]
MDENRARGSSAKSDNTLLEIQMKMTAFELYLDGRIGEVSRDKKGMACLMEEAIDEKEMIDTFYYRRSNAIRGEFNRRKWNLTGGYYGGNLPQLVQRDLNNLHREYQNEDYRLNYSRQREQENWGFLVNVRQSDFKLNERLLSQLFREKENFGRFLNRLTCDREKENSTQIVESILSFLEENEKNRIELTQRHTDRYNCLIGHHMDLTQRLDVRNVTEIKIDSSFRAVLAHFNARLNMIAEDNEKMKELRILINNFLDEMERRLTGEPQENSVNSNNISNDFAEEKADSDFRAEKEKETVGGLLNKGGIFGKSKIPVDFVEDNEVASKKLPSKYEEEKRDWDDPLSSNLRTQHVAKENLTPKVTKPTKVPTEKVHPPTDDITSLEDVYRLFGIHGSLDNSKPEISSSSSETISSNVFENVENTDQKSNHKEICPELTVQKGKSKTENFDSSSSNSPPVSTSKPSFSPNPTSETEKTVNDGFGTLRCGGPIGFQISPHFGKLPPANNSYIQKPFEYGNRRYFGSTAGSTSDSSSSSSFGSFSNTPVRNPQQFFVQNIPPSFYRDNSDGSFSNPPVRNSQPFIAQKYSPSFSRDKKGELEKALAESKKRLDEQKERKMQAEIEAERIAEDYRWKKLEREQKIRETSENQKEKLKEVDYALEQEKEELEQRHLQQEEMWDEELVQLAEKAEDEENRLGKNVGEFKRTLAVEQAWDEELAVLRKSVLELLRLFGLANYEISLLKKCKKRAGPVKTDNFMKLAEKCHLECRNLQEIYTNCKNRLDSLIEQNEKEFLKEIRTIVMSLMDNVKTLDHGFSEEYIEDLLLSKNPSNDSMWLSLKSSIQDLEEIAKNIPSLKMTEKEPGSVFLIDELIPKNPKEVECPRGKVRQGFIKQFCEKLTSQKTSTVNDKKQKKQKKALLKGNSDNVPNYADNSPQIFSPEAADKENVGRPSAPISNLTEKSWEDFETLEKFEYIEAICDKIDSLDMNAVLADHLKETFQSFEIVTEERLKEEVPIISNDAPETENPQEDPVVIPNSSAEVVEVFDSQPIAVDQEVSTSSDPLNGADLENCTNFMELVDIFLVHFKSLQESYMSSKNCLEKVIRQKQIDSLLEVKNDMMRLSESLEQIEIGFSEENAENFLLPINPGRDLMSISLDSSIEISENILKILISMRQLKEKFA